MKTRHIALAALLAAFINIAIQEVLPRVAFAHTGSPAMVTWQDGDQLNATDLNNALAHLHNTFTNGIIDANISSSAAISHSKLATPPLVSKAYLSTITVCAGGGAAGTDCASVESSGFDTVTGAAEAAGVTGVYRFNLNYTPATTNFAVLVTSFTSSLYCSANTTSVSKPHFKVNCYDAAGSLTDAAFSVIVLDQ